jgi:DNA-binding GntR family transcriptional regulator
MYTARDAGEPGPLDAPPDAAGAVRPRRQAPTRGDDAYRTLKTWVLRGEFPLNVRLAEPRLAAMLGTSRTPVREALRRLRSESLIEDHPSGGFRPAVPDTVVMRHLYEVRSGLELQALQRPARLGTRHDPTIIEPLRDEWRRMARGEPPPPDPDFVLLDEDFHERLAVAAGNRVAADMLHQVNERIRIVRMHDFLTAERIDQTIEEHLRIAELVLAGKLVEAESAFSAHLAASMAVVEERARDAILRMATGGQP